MAPLIRIPSPCSEKWGSTARKCRRYKVHPTLWQIDWKVSSLLSMHSLHASTFKVEISVASKMISKTPVFHIHYIVAIRKKEKFGVYDLGPVLDHAKHAILAIRICPPCMGNSFFVSWYLFCCYLVCQNDCMHRTVSMPQTLWRYVNSTPKHLPPLCLLSQHEWGWSSRPIHSALAPMYMWDFQ